MNIDRKDVEKTKKSLQEVVDDRRVKMELDVENLRKFVELQQNALRKKEKELEDFQEVQAFADWSLKLWKINLKNVEEAQEKGDKLALESAYRSLDRHETGFRKIEAGWSKFRDKTWDGIWTAKKEEIIGGGSDS